ncbi:MAG: metal-dependent hydrolase [Myxococcota bacterium]
MDPVSQGVLGGALAGSGATTRTSLRPALLAGLVGGLLPDLDVLIRSEVDPLLSLEYHRQFTHSLIFIPVGGLVATFLLWPILRRRLSMRHLYGFATAGYATHALLDACTSYGTQLYWPFSDTRVAWNVISVVDPLYTLPLLLCIVVTLVKRDRRIAIAGLTVSLLYLTLGAVQHGRAVTAAEQIIATRGHTAERLLVQPSFANLVVWKSVYEASGRYYVDALRLGYEARLYSGESVRKLDVRRDLPWLRPASRQANDLERFRWFSAGWLAPDERIPYAVGDIRYSLAPNQVAPLWRVVFDPQQPEKHVEFDSTRDGATSAAGKLWDMIVGEATPQNSRTGTHLRQ